MKGVGLAAVVLVWASACSNIVGVSDIQFVDAGSDATKGDGATEGGSPEGAPAPESGPTDAPTAGDSPISTNPCDQDGDGYLADSDRCGGTDCCDIDPSAHPMQATFFTTADRCGSFDYNCDGSTELEYAEKVACEMGAQGCFGGTGFTGTPACGASGPFGTCIGTDASCGMGTTTNVTQACH